MPQHFLSRPSLYRFALVAFVGLTAALTTLAADRVTVPAPTVTGPIALTAKAPDPSHGYPFNPTYLDLASKGYVEEEFFIEGTANRYKPEREATSAVIDSGNGQIVIVDKGEGRFEPRSVRLGRRGAGYVEIRDGVKGGESVVTSANFLIDAESNLKAALKGLSDAGAPQ